MNMLDRLSEALRGLTGRESERLRLFQAPARVNIIGEHTDYNGGLVLPTNTAIYTWLAIAGRDDHIIEVRSENLDKAGRFKLDHLEPAAEVDWLEYVKGVAAILEAEGIELRGANILIDSDIPIGAGLSSSASLELAVAAALLAIADQSLPARRAAELCQQAEHLYARVQCGLMDQYVIACAGKGKAILLDCESVEATQVDIPPEIGFVITDSGVRHRLPDDQYNDRRDECERARQLLTGRIPGLQSLRGLDLQTLEANSEVLDDALYRRCRHVITENERVRQAVAALEAGTPELLGKLIDASHASLRDDFEVSCAEIEALVRTANECNGVLGSRMVGGGFGGCVLSLTTAGEQEQVAAEIRDACARISGKVPWTHLVEAANPVQEIQYQ